MEQKALQSVVHDPDVEELTSDWSGRFAVGARNTMQGTLAWYLGEAIADPFADTENYPLNLKFSKSEYLATPFDQRERDYDNMSIVTGNNPETIAEDLQGVPFDQWSYILSSKTYGQYKDRVRFIKAGLPEAQALGSGLGYTVAALGDLSTYMSVGLAAEPLALAGLGARTTLAGRAAAASSGTFRTVSNIATSAAEAAATVSRTNLAFRFGAYGVAEQAVWSAVKNQIDPLYQPDAGDIVYELTLAGGLAAGLGGVAFGRQFVKDHIEEAARELRATRTVNLPGGYTVTYSDRLAFDSPAAADVMLFARGTGNVQEEADRIARALWLDWERSPVRVDLTLPGTRSVSLPVLDEAAAARLTGTFDTGDALIPAATPSWSSLRTRSEMLSAIGLSGNKKPSLLDILTGMQKKGLVEFADNNSPFFNYEDRVGIMVKVGDMRIPFYISTGLGGKAGVPARKWYPFFGVTSEGWMVKLTEKEIRDSYGSPVLRNIKAFLDETVGDIEEQFFAKGGGRDAEFDALLGRLVSGGVGDARTLKETNEAQKLFMESTGYSPTASAYALKYFKTILPNLGKSTVRPEVLSRTSGDGTIKNFINMFVSDLEAAARSTTSAAPAVRAMREVRDAAGRIPARPKMGQVVGLRSAIKAAAFELSLAGMKLDEQVFSKIAQALVKVERSKLKAGGFNKAFWSELSKDLPSDVVAGLRQPSERAFIGGIDRSVADLSMREDMVDSVLDAFKKGQHQDPKNEKSLIFQVLEQIRTRGGTVNRETVGEVVDELRSISQNPPKRVNANGRTVLDPDARRLAVAEIINKRAKGGKEIYIPPSLLKKMNPVVTRGGVAAAKAGAKGPTGTAPDKNWASVPRALKPFFERIPLWEHFGNQAARALNSENGAIRSIAWMAFNARRNFDVAQPQTIFEAGTAAMHSLMFSFMKGYRNQYIRFALGNGSQNIPMDKVTLGSQFKKAFFQGELRRDFNRRVAQQLRTGAYDDGLDAVNDAARGFREIFNKVHSMAAAVGLRGFDKAAVVNYMPRLWRFDKIRRLATTEAGRKDMVALVRTAIDQNGRKVVIDGVEQTITGDLDEAAKAFTERLISIAKNTENAPLTEQDQELFDALSNLLGPLKAKTPSKTPFGRGRLLLNESASVRLSGDHLGDGSAALSIADLTNDDLPFVFRKYVTSVMGAINEKRLIDGFNAEARARGVFAPTKTVKGQQVQEYAEATTVDEMIALATKIGGEVDKNHLEGLREVIAAIRYEPLHRGSSGLGDKVLGILLPYGYLITGGMFGAAALGEIARVVGTMGLRQTLEQMPILKEMTVNWKNLDREGQNFASLIDSWFSPSTDRLRRSFMDTGGGQVYGTVTGAGKVYAGAKKALDSTANLMSDISGLAPITSFSQQLAAATTLQHLYEAGRGLSSKLDDATVRSLGLEPEEYGKIVDFVSRNAKTREGFRGPRVVDMDNIDAVEMDQVKAFVDRVVTSRIQNMPTRGDFHKSVFSFAGRLFTQFRTFNLKGVDNFLIQNAGRVNRGGGAKVAQEIMATAVFAATIQYLRNYGAYRSAENAGDTEKMERMENLLGVSGFLRGGVMGPSEFFLPTTAMDMFWTGNLGKDPIFSPYRYSGLDWYGFPGQAIVDRALGLRKDLYGATIGKQFELSVERDITQSTIRKARLLTPFQNMPLIRSFLDAKERDFIEEYNLPKAQPRRKSTTD